LLEDYYISWWNLENLFDYQEAKRSKKLKRVLQSELKGWTAKILDRKLSQLAKIIIRMNDGKGPDILGVCEVENRKVLKKLVKKLKLDQRKYAIIHENMNDRRGVDIAFLYDTKKFVFQKKFSQWILRRNATREILQVNFKIKKTRSPFVLIGNHWPARVGGTYETAPYRMLAGETLSYFHKRICDEMGKNIPILVMGDFNDEPFDRSLTAYALAVRNSNELKRARTPKLFNLMWSLLSKDLGTYHYGGKKIILDQFLISRGFLFGNSKLIIKNNLAKIEDFKEMKRGSNPKKFGRPSKKNLNQNGFSDHFPISVTIENIKN